MNKTYSTTLISLILIITAAIFYMAYASLTVSVCFMMLSLVIVLFGNRNRLILTAGFIAGNIIMLLIYEYYISKFGIDFPYYLGGSDDYHFELNALTFASDYSIFDYNLIRGGLVPSWHNSPGYIYIVALEMKFVDLFGIYHTLIPRIFNLFLLTALAGLTYKFARQRLQLNHKSSFIALLAVLFVPLMVYYSSHIYRDTIVAIIFVHCFYLITAKKINTTAIIFLAIEMTILSQLRFLSFAFIALFIASILFRELNNKYIKYMLLSVVFGLVVLFFISFNIMDQLDYYNSRYTDYRQSLSDGMARKIFELPLFIGIVPRLLYLSVIPVPNFEFDFVRLYLSLGTTLQMIYFPTVVISTISMLRKNIGVERHLALAFSVLYIGIALTSFADRQLLMLYPFGILILMYGLEKNSLIKKNKAALLFGGSAFTFFIVSFYNVFLAH